MSNLVQLDIGFGDEGFELIGSTEVDGLELIILRRPDTNDVLMLCVDEDGGLSPLVDEDVFHKAFLNWGMSKMLQKYNNVVSEVSDSMKNYG